ncbi:zinc finger, C3HC4 type (RING finger) protein (macronuclear) [Tetrahymena thermophila SB210]|uniref:Zinc finger, C3HC4 type (RING finger) protein n=1 Tax=Tetrahymena thermophila (strain SB210) TaxID=312017 RepID=W7XFB5_TETTS|nr:zinc finger, C3HC4 type (RING finger) protein [Tetrahymena thermophila SB210]EWS76502.1 zinc finger, C3HC4 type (RING finger) protein [Tetrahymena thermophila SB210]|eukprot:XP_012650963.1 zinc finger, C3HC4 type (RING finger) protein [Tetrahymena thermophila SB210]
MGNINVFQHLNKSIVFTCIISLGFGISAVRCYNDIQKLQKKVTWMEESKFYSPSECSEEFDKLVQQRVKETSQDSQQLTENELLFKKVIVQGAVQCQQPLQSKIDQNVNNLIYRYNFCIVKYSNDELKNIFDFTKFANQKKQNQVCMYVPEFNLVDEKDLEKKIEVCINLEPKICQTSINHYTLRYTDRQLSLLHKFQAKFSTFVNILGMLFQKDKYFSFSKGIEIGFNEHEIGIKSGGTLAIIGDVIYNFQTKELKMINPLTIIGKKADYIRRLITKQKEKKFYFYFFIVISCLSSYYVYNQIKKAQRAGRMLINQQQDSLKNVQKALVKEINDMKCDLCNDQNKQMIYKPCGHLVCCKSCSTSKNIQLCQICNKQITEIVEIYFS